jgi:anti-sigma factor RsiW
MKHALEADLLRLLHGELRPDEARALRERLAREPELAAAWRRLERAWEGLALPPPAPVPLGFSGRVMARVRELRQAETPKTSEASGAISWAAAPRWVRASCAAALLAGVLLGAGLGSRRPVERQRGSETVPALTESYWELAETPNGPADAAPALPSSPRGEGRR